MNYIDNLNWRYAVKKFDKEKKISDKIILNIIKAISLTPSSYGLQPYKIILIKDIEFRKSKLQNFSIHNNQISEASHLILFTIETNFSISNIDKHIDYIINERKTSLNKLIHYKKSISSFINNLDKKKLEIWQTEQIYICLGALIYYCAIEKIDTCPIGGFNKLGFDKVLNLEKLNLKSVVLIALGYRSKNDKNQYLKKIRKPIKDILLKY